jgi:hypothetical protein
MNRLPQACSLTIACLAVIASFSGACAGQDVRSDEVVYSGPQAGEPLGGFEFRVQWGGTAGKNLDIVSQAAGQPIVLIFVHDVNRQSIRMTRVLSQYTASRAKDGLQTAVVFLNEDATAAEEQLKRMRHALTPDVTTGVYLGGPEGPGSYGLNRNVTLTVLVGKDGRVRANYALIQPSLQVDLPKILESVVGVAGGDVPKLEELEGMRDMMNDRPTPGTAPDMRALLGPVIRRGATNEEVERAAQTVEQQARQNSAVRSELSRIATTIVNSGKLNNYGTPRAQEFLSKWAQEFGNVDSPKPDHGAKDQGESEAQR